MKQFDEREKAFENKFKRDQELQFKVQVRRNRLLGLWAGKQMGLDADSAEVYAKEVVAADFSEPGDADVMKKVQGDLQAKGIDMSEHLIRKEMDRLLEVAREQIFAEN